ncbi:MAG TPA: HAD-IC family P-type ATPase, partial [Anaerolineales bacterium]|nr:HAD-IC family P-type ATPase [Anaerolineales bacterium]
MDENKQHAVHDHSQHAQPKKDGHQPDPNNHQEHSAMNHPTHSMDDHSAHDQHQGHVLSATPGMAQADHSAHAGHGTDHTGHEQMFRVRFWWSLLLSIPVLLYSGMIQMWLGFTPPAFPFSEWIPFVFSLIVFGYGGVPFLQMAIPELRERKPGMMTLISLAISVAFIYSVAAQFINLGEGFFWELVTLIDIMLLGHWLEMRSVRQASGALNELAKLMPDTAERIQQDDTTETIAASALRKGDLVLVRPGASIPADGEVMDGHSNVSEAMITGESMPVHKMAGAKVIAGTINGDGSLRVRVTATGNETALAGIMRLVEQAQQSKSQTQVLADKAAGWLFYIALAAALLTAVAWTIAQGFNLEALTRVVT